MSFRNINKTFNTIINESLVVEDATEGDLRHSLENAVKNLRNQGVTNLKQYEYTLQDALESVYPDKCWWEVTSCQIFDTMFFDRLQPEEVIDCIIDNLIVDDAIDETLESNESSSTIICMNDDLSTAGSDYIQGCAYKVNLSKGRELDFVGSLINVCGSFNTSIAQLFDMLKEFNISAEMILDFEEEFYSDNGLYQRINSNNEVEFIDDDTYVVDHVFKFDSLYTYEDAKNFEELSNALYGDSNLSLKEIIANELTASIDETVLNETSKEI